jgi:hypothetical protein
MRRAEQQAGRGVVRAGLRVVRLQAGRRGAAPVVVSPFALVACAFEERGPEPGLGCPVPARGPVARLATWLAGRVVLHGCRGRRACQL